MRRTMKEFMEAVNIISENMEAMFGKNVQEPEVSISSNCVEAKYWIQVISDFNCVKFTVASNEVSVSYRHVGSGWEDYAPDTVIGNCVEADVKKILNVLNVEDETEE